MRVRSHSKCIIQIEKKTKVKAISVATQKKDYSNLSRFLLVKLLNECHFDFSPRLDIMCLKVFTVDFVSMYTLYKYIRSICVCTTTQFVSRTSQIVYTQLSHPSSWPVIVLRNLTDNRSYQHTPCELYMYICVCVYE